MYKITVDNIEQTVDDGAILIDRVSDNEVTFELDLEQIPLGQTIRFSVSANDMRKIQITDTEEYDDGDDYNDDDVICVMTFAPEQEEEVNRKLKRLEAQLKLCEEVPVEFVDEKGNVIQEEKIEKEKKEDKVEKPEESVKKKRGRKKKNVETAETVENEKVETEIEAEAVVENTVADVETTESSEKECDCCCSDECSCQVNEEDTEYTEDVEETDGIEELEESEDETNNEKPKKQKVKYARQTGHLVKQIPTPTCTGDVAPTLMATGYGTATYKNFYSVGHFPKLGILEVWEDNDQDAARDAVAEQPVSVEPDMNVDPNDVSVNVVDADSQFDVHKEPEMEVDNNKKESLVICASEINSGENIKDKFSKRSMTLSMIEKNHSYALF